MVGIVAACSITQLLDFRGKIRRVLMQRVPPQLVWYRHRHCATRLQEFRRRIDRFLTNRVTPHLPIRMHYENDHDAMEVPFLDTMNELSTFRFPIEVAVVPHECVVMVDDVQEQNQPVQDSSEITYSVLAPRSYYYEVVKQTKVKPRSNALRFVEEAHMYAVELQPNFIHYLAERTAMPDDASLHVCVTIR